MKNRDEQINVLMIGLGSVGQRHLRNLKKILGENVNFYAYRKRGKKDLFDDDLRIIPSGNVETVYKITVFEDYYEALEQNPDIVVIANPTSMHIEYAIEAAKHGCDLMIEKPISDSLNHVSKLREIVKEKNLIAYVGFQNRFHPCVSILKECVRTEKIGKILFGNCEVGELLTDMHKYEDYRNQYLARKELGGGVVLNQIHELDYLYWLFGKPISIYSVGGKLSDLEIDVEDCVSSLCIFVKDGRNVPIHIHQDFLQKPASRKCVLIGSEGKIEIDLLNSMVTISINDGTLYSEEFPEFRRNDMFLEEMKEFLECFYTRKTPLVSIQDGEASLSMALAIRKSFSKGVVVKKI